MNRQIIFRGKIVDSIKKGQWEYGSLLINPEKEYLIWSEERELFVKVEPNTIGQFTGLKDKNGVDIYEDDIVINQSSAKRVVKRIKTGEYRLFCGNYHSNFTTDWKKGTQFEIVGNIHDNLELLTDK